VAEQGVIDKKKPKNKQNRRARMQITIDATEKDAVVWVKLRPNGRANVYMIPDGPKKPKVIILNAVVRKENENAVL